MTSRKSRNVSHTLLWLLTVLVAVIPLAAQDLLRPQSQPPSQARGTSLHSAFDFGNLDSINLYNGNLTLSLPIGQSYQAGGQLAYRLELVYNSNVWDYEESCTEYMDPPIGPLGAEMTYFHAIPNQLSNAGMGWSLSLGRILKGDNPSLTPTGLPAYVGSDGSRRGFHGSLRPGVAVDGAQVTRDGSYIRRRDEPQNCFAPGAPAGCKIYLDFPDGSVHTFENIGTPPASDWRVTRIEDPFANAITVDYDGDRWTIRDAENREQIIRFDRPDLPGTTATPRIDRIEMTGFDGQTSVFDLEYTTATIERHRFEPFGTGQCDANQPLGGITEQLQIDLLSKLTLADGSFFEMDYYLEDDFANGKKSGVVRGLRLPTGGGLGFEYDLYKFKENFRTLLGSPRKNYGVVRKSRYESYATLLVGGAPDGTWTYEHSWGKDELGDFVQSPWDEFTFANNPESLGFAPCFFVNEVTDPLGHKTRHYFQAAQEGFRRHDALPFTVCHPRTGVLYDTDGDGSPDTDIDVAPHETENAARPPYFISREIYENDGTAEGRLVRREYVGYDVDGFSGNPPGLGIQDGDFNRRVRHRRTEFLDDPDDADSDEPGHQTHYTAIDNTDFDGFGNFRTSRRRSTLPGQANQDRWTNHNPGGAVPAVGSPWILDVVDRQTVTQGPNTPQPQISSGLSCVEAATGFVMGERQFAEGDSEGPGDKLVIYERDSRGFRTGESHFGGDAQDLSSHVGCGEPSLSPQFEIAHTYSAGAIETSTFLDCAGQPFLSAADHDIDANTGLIATSRDPAGVATTFDYDPMGRRILSATEGLGPVRTLFDFAAVSSGPVSTAEVRVCPIGQVGCSAASAVGRDISIFDGLGRAVKEQKLLPLESGSGLAERTTRFNDLGWILETSVWADEGQSATAAAMEYEDHDRFGRARRIVQPDGSVIDVSHQGKRWTERRVNVETSNGPAASVIEELRDGLGRLTVVSQHLDGDDVLDRTTYRYDEGGRLSHVCIDDDDDNALTCGAGQQRLFDYDGRGLLRAEWHPEVGSSAPEWTFLQYDAFGNTTEVDAPGTAFDLRNTYDRGARLTQVRTPAGQWLKQLFYGRSNAGLDLRAGKLVTARRHNFVATTQQPAGEEVVITERFRYAGPGGQVSSHAVRSSRGPVFETHFDDYDAFGHVTQMRYPGCDRPPCGLLGDGRSQTFGYGAGLPTSVAGLASSITYHPNGQLARLAHSNGVADVQTLDGDGWRLAGIAAQGIAGGAWNYGPYSYDPAGNITGIGGETFRYDRVSRLTEGTVTTPAGQNTQAVTYDVYSNLRSITLTGADPGPSPGVLAVDGRNRLTSHGAQFDAAGNLTRLTLGGTTYAITHDPFSRATSLSAPGVERSYLYDATDERVAVLDLATGEEMWTARDRGHQVLSRFVLDGQGWRRQKDYFHAGGRQVAAAENGVTRHFHLDHLNSTRRITDSGAQVVEANTFYPFGGYAEAPVANVEELQFTGHERDGHGVTVEGDLDYMHARYYTPFLGRFLSVDPKTVRDPARNSQRWNRYVYAHNNPLLKIDPDGRDALAVTFVGYKIPVDFRFFSRKLPLGHSGITISKGGHTRYYESGRYANGVRVQYKGPLPDFQLGSNDLPTRASLKNYLSALTVEAGQSKPVEGAYFINDQEDAMIQYAEARIADPNLQGEYNFLGNSCATFCRDMLEVGGEDTGVTLVKSPNRVIKKLQSKADFAVSYDPETEELEVTCENDELCPE